MDRHAGWGSARAHREPVPPMYRTGTARGVPGGRGPELSRIAAASAATGRDDQRLQWFGVGGRSPGFCRGRRRDAGHHGDMLAGQPQQRQHRIELAGTPRGGVAHPNGPAVGQRLHHSSVDFPVPHSSPAVIIAWADVSSSIGGGPLRRTCRGPRCVSGTTGSPGPAAIIKPCLDVSHRRARPSTLPAPVWLATRPAEQFLDRAR